jgi:hypothetical protein
MEITGCCFPLQTLRVFKEHVRTRLSAVVVPMSEAMTEVIRRTSFRVAVLMSTHLHRLSTTVNMSGYFTLNTPNAFNVRFYCTIYSISNVKLMKE